MMGTSPLAAIALLLPLFACTGSTSVSSGDTLYRRNCASCHGVGGRGDGPAAPALSPPPTDLTKLRANVPELMQVIDGRTTVRAHGTSAMPVWGEVFEQIHLDGAHAKRLALLQVQALADYVAQLGQAAPAPAE